MFFKIEGKQYLKNKSKFVIEFVKFGKFCKNVKSYWMLRNKKKIIKVKKIKTRETILVKNNLFK